MKLNQFTDTLRNSVHLPSPQNAAFAHDALQHFIAPEAKPAQRFPWRKFSVGFTSFSAAFCLLGLVFLQTQVKATVSVDINPSVSLSLNYFDRVIDIEAINADGVELLANLDVTRGTPGEIIDEIIQESVELGTLPHGETVTVLLGVSAHDYAIEQDIQAEIALSADQTDLDFLFLNRHEENSPTTNYSGNVIVATNGFDAFFDYFRADGSETAIVTTTAGITNSTWVPEGAYENNASADGLSDDPSAGKSADFTGLTEGDFQALIDQYHVSEAKMTLAILIIKGNSGYTLQGDLNLLLSMPVSDLVRIYDALP